MTEEASHSPEILIVNAQSVASEDLAKKGAINARVRHLIDERHGSGRFALREYTLTQGGHTPLDQHSYEHQVYVLTGEGILRMGTEGALMRRKLKPGDTIFIPSNAVHQFINEREEPFVFLCVKGNPALYESSLKTNVTEEVGVC